MSGSLYIKNVVVYYCKCCNLIGDNNMFKYYTIRLYCLQYCGAFHLKDLSLYIYLTNRLHFPVSVYCNRSHADDVIACKEQNVRHETKSSGATVVLYMV